MVIWVIGRNYPLPENGMQGSFELEQAKMLSRFGNDVHYLACCLHPIKRIKKRGLQSWTDEGVKVTVLSAFFAPRVYPFYFVKERNRLWSKLLDEAERSQGIPDVIHVHYPSMLMIADSLAVFREKGVRIVATEHWSKVLAKKLDTTELREYKKYGSVLNKLICVGAPLKNAVKELTGIEGVVVPNIVNRLFQPATAGHDGYGFVAVGRLVKFKQFDRIIDAFWDCFSDQKDVTLTIIGGGDEMANLRKKVEERQAGDRIKLLGSQDRKRTAELVSNSDSLVCYSNFETFGVPVIEAWACGLPVVTTTATAVLDPFDERLGFEISPDDFEGLKKAMRRLYEQREAYDKGWIVHFVNERFSESAVYEKLLGVYQETRQ